MRKLETYRIIAFPHPHTHIRTHAYLLACRRLSAAAESASVAFDHISVGAFAEPLCSESGNFEATTSCACSSTQKSKMDTLAVKNSAGTVIGQLLGDGRGIRSEGTFTSATTCLPFRDDVRTQSFFTQYDVAKYDPSSKSWTSLNMDVNDANACTSHASCVQLTAAKICFKATSVGQYFPILKIPNLSTAGSQTCEFRP